MGGSLAKTTEARKKAFLEAFATCGVIREACRAAKVERTTVYFWRQNDEQFAKAFDEAEAVAAEVLISEARRRAADGYDEFVVSGGRLIVGDNGQPLLQRRYSDGLLKFLIERREGKPTQRIEHAGDVKKPKELAPEYLASVLSELNRRSALAPREDPD